MPRFESFIVDWVRAAISEGRGVELFDPEIINSEILKIILVEITSSDGNEAKGTFEELYVQVSADTYDKFDAAVALIEMLVTPVSILWPDGIFLTKHPKRRRPSLSGTTPQSSPHGQPPTPQSSPPGQPPTAKHEGFHQLDEQQQMEAEQRAKLVHELMIGNAPNAIVGLFGQKEYEQCAMDLYYFLQSSVCLKLLAFDLLELLLLSSFPEMDYIFRPLHEQKYKFGEFSPS
ncbi:hypothetical protein RHGRI_012602 [Rhododendron griersonianum]|uniref:Sorting nexin C-terminal domain-containing protein n=1 Tax=Rhododendron griersonianum TaxID=479676 RepID=A0AAV6KSU6_9ERIC|nr:hypothetical protein RHGRI_012602 [Rhododendron griersonianum]